MSIDRDSLKVLRYIYRRKGVSYGKLKSRFREFDIPAIVSRLSSLELLSVELRSSGGGSSPYRSWIDDDCGIRCSLPGKAYVDDHRLFTGSYIVSNIVVPVVIAIISTLLTIFLTTLLSTVL